MVCADTFSESIVGISFTSVTLERSVSCNVVSSLGANVMIVWKDSADEFVERDDVFVHDPFRRSRRCIPCADRFSIMREIRVCSKIIIDFK